MQMKTVGAALVLSVLLAACGGGGGDAGQSAFGAGGGASSPSTTTSGSTSTTTNEAGSIVVSVNSRTISSSAPGVVTALVKDASGTPVENAIVTFAVTNGALAVLGSTSGMTDATGEASTTITPNPSATTGATTVTASVTLPGSSSALTAQYAFSVSAMNVTLDSVTLATPGQLDAYASKAIDVAVSAASSSAPLTLKATSTCATQGKATISPSSLILTGTTGSFTYQDNGCGATDQVTVQIQGTSQTKAVDIEVKAPVAIALTFDKATPETLCLMGSGCDGTSTVTFKVVGSGGQGLAGRSVNFGLTQSGSATLSATSGVTDSSGIVSVRVSSGVVPTPVRVTAALADATEINTVSNELSIRSGLPYQSGMTFSAKAYTLDGNLNGDSTEMTVHLIDRFGNPVADGTPVTFVAEGGSATPGSCFTAGGNCSVNFVVQNPKPADGRVTVVAFSQGEEDFIDNNNNNLYDPLDTFDIATMDLGPVHVDNNMNDTVDPGERLIGAAKNGEWDNNTYVRSSFEMVMTNTVSKPRLFEVAGGACTDTAFTGASVSLGGATCNVNVDVCVKDGNTSGSNPIVAGSKLSVTPSGNDVKATITPAEILPHAMAPTVHTIAISRANCGTVPAAQRNVDLTIEVKGTTWTFGNAAITVNNTP